MCKYDSDTPYLSIVTPTYNRAALLRRCYMSLYAQTCRDFEWIVVDDGSDDDTEKVMREITDECELFGISYIKKQNGGKHTALNAAHGSIRGRFVLILDSDDTLTDTAVAQISETWRMYDSNSEVGIVTFLRGRSADDPSCVVSDWNVPVDIMRYKRTCIHSSDCCEVIRTELFKQYPFPVFEGEKFLSEGALWNRVSFCYKCIYINSVVYICEYLEGGLTRSGKPLRIRNPHGGMYTSNLNMSRKNFFMRRVKNGLLYVCYGFFAKQRPKEMASNCCAKTLMWCCLPFGYLLYKLWGHKYG